MSNIILWLSIISIVSRKLNLPFVPTSKVNCNFVCKELKKIKVSLTVSDGSASKISSTYLNLARILIKILVKKLTRDLRAFLVRWKRDQFIELTYRRLLTSAGVIPRAYGLTKIHKEGYPLRVIVSCINSPYITFLSFYTI